ncbi:MAG TPA: GNAT family N-acetyltransferase [Jiangellaceae bacterium]
MSESGVRVETIGPDDWRTWRDLRLASLLDAPAAFGSTYEQWRDADETRWRARLEAPGVLMVARLDDEPVGTAGGFFPSSSEAELISMWVAPAGRGRGVGDALVEAVLAWARRQAAPAIGLWVAEGNAPAEALYARHGFLHTGRRQPLPSQSGVEEIAMRRSLVS